MIDYIGALYIAHFLSAWMHDSEIDIFKNDKDKRWPKVGEQKCKETKALHQIGVHHLTPNIYIYIYPRKINTKPMPKDTCYMVTRTTRATNTANSDPFSTCSFWDEAPLDPP